MSNGKFLHCTSLEQMLQELVSMQRDGKSIMRTDNVVQTPKRLVEKVQEFVEAVRKKLGGILHIPETICLDEMAKNSFGITNQENFREVLCANIRRLPNVHDHSVDMMIWATLDRINTLIGDLSTPR